MKVQFQSKEERKLEQERTFLLLSPAERFTYWLDLMVVSLQIPRKTNLEKSDNFLIEIAD